MKGILITAENTHFQEDAFEFAGRMHNVNPVLLSDKFRFKADYISLGGHGGAVSGPLYISAIEIPEYHKIEANIAGFERLCSQIESRLK